MKKTYLKSKKGITIIALIVTIIVLIIISGISVVFLLGSNGILDKAKIAKESYNNGEDIEDQKINGMNEIIEGTTRGGQASAESSIISNVDFNVTSINTFSLTIQITATATDNSKIIGYHIFAVSKADSSVIAHVTENSTFTITGLTQNTTYTIYVKAYDIDDNYKISGSKDSTTASQLYLYKDGDQCTSITGGWSNSACNTTGSTVFEANDIYMTSSQWGGQGVTPKNQLDYTGYSKYCYEITIYNVDGRPYIWNTLRNFTDGTDVNIHTFTCTDQVIKADISTINAKKNIGFLVNNNGSVRIYKVWLEK